MLSQVEGKLRNVFSMLGTYGVNVLRIIIQVIRNLYLCIVTTRLKAVNSSFASYELTSNVPCFNFVNVLVGYFFNVLKY